MDINSLQKCEKKKRSLNLVFHQDVRNLGKIYLMINKYTPESLLLSIADFV